MRLYLTRNDINRIDLVRSEGDGFRVALIHDGAVRVERLHRERRDRLDGVGVLQARVNRERDVGRSRCRLVECIVDPDCPGGLVPRHRDDARQTDSYRRREYQGRLVNVDLWRNDYSHVAKNI